MTLRKFGTENGGVEVNPEDQQGLSKTAMAGLTDGEEIVEDGEDDLGCWEAEGGRARRDRRGRVTGVVRPDGSRALPGEEV
jgi:hypothetical protein